MHKLVIRTHTIKEVVQRLVDAGFSPAQAKALILTIKLVHDGPWEEPDPGLEAAIEEEK